MDTNAKQLTSPIVEERTQAYQMCGVLILPTPLDELYIHMCCGWNRFYTVYDVFVQTIRPGTTISMINEGLKIALLIEPGYPPAVYDKLSFQFPYDDIVWVFKEQSTQLMIAMEMDGRNRLAMCQPLLARLLNGAVHTCRDHFHQTLAYANICALILSSQRGVPSLHCPVPDICHFIDMHAAQFPIRPSVQLVARQHFFSHSSTPPLDRMHISGKRP